VKASDSRLLLLDADDRLHHMLAVAISKNKSKRRLFLVRREECTNQESKGNGWKRDNSWQQQQQDKRALYFMRLRI